MSSSSQVLAQCVLWVWLSSAGLASSQDTLATQAKPFNTLDIVVTSVEKKPVAFRIIAHAENAAVEMAKGTTPWKQSLDIDRKFDRLQAVADGYWAEDIALSEMSGLPIQLHLVPATALVAALRVPDTSPTPKKVSLEIAKAQRPLSQAETHWRQSTSCEIEKQGLVCAVPVGEIDLCLRIQHLSAQCFWGLAAEPEKRLDLGIVEFNSGATLSGVLDTKDPSLDLRNIKINLKPRTAAASPDPLSSRRRRILGRETASDAHGRFIFTGLKPGEYYLRAEKEGYFGVKQRVRISPDTLEMRLEEPLLLELPASLDLGLDPPLDPWKRPWTIRLTRPLESPNVHETVREDSADRAGRWGVAGTTPGSYSIRIGDSKDATWAAYDWTLDSGENHRFISIDLIPIRGQLAVGDEGLEAEIVFGTTRGMVQVAVQSDQDGKFEGALPYEGFWEVDLRIDRDWGSQGLEPIEVRRRPGKSYAQVDIELPDTALQGNVVYQGKSAEALVLALREQQPQAGIPVRRREIVLKTDQDGKFAVRGLAPGSFEIHAYNRTASSTWQTVHLQEGMEPALITLELKQIRELQGRLVGPLGGVSGARIEMMPSHGLPRTLVSEVDGSFRLRIESGAIFVDFFVLPPGSGFFLRRVSLSSGDNAQPIELQLIPESGNIVLRELTSEAWLKFNGYRVSLKDLRRWLLQDGRVRGHWSGGFQLSNAAVGQWSVCYEGAESCQEQTLLAGGEVIFHGQETEPGEGQENASVE